MECKNHVFFLLFSILFCSRLFAGEIVVTDVKKEKNNGRQSYEITINNCITIRDIEVIERGPRKELKFPDYISQKKQAFPQAMLLTRQSNEAVKKAIFEGAVGAGQIPLTEYKITQFSKFNKKSSLKVICAVSFNDAVEIECKIIEGKNGPWVAWPSRKLKNKGGWVDQIVITDKRMREAVEQDILSKYDAMLAEGM